VSFICDNLCCISLSLRVRPALEVTEAEHDRRSSSSD
jgi:hypothetical protein